MNDVTSFGSSSNPGVWRELDGAILHRIDETARTLRLELSQAEERVVRGNTEVRERLRQELEAVEGRITGEVKRQDEITQSFRNRLSGELVEIRTDLTGHQSRIKDLESAHIQTDAVEIWKRRALYFMISSGMLILAIIGLVIDLAVHK